MNHPRLKSLHLIAVLTLCAVAVTECQSRLAQARFDREVPWHGRGVWLRADTHVHTRFSDGGHTVEDVVA